MTRKSGRSHSGSSRGTCEACGCAVEVYGRDSNPLYENRSFREALRGHLLNCLGIEKAKQALRERLNEYDNRGRRIESRG